MMNLEEVVLRPFEPKDVEHLYRFRNDWEAIRLLGGFSAGYSRKNLEQWIASHRNRADEAIFAICNPKNDHCLGHVGLYQIDNRVRKAEFAILIGDRNWWGRGIGRKVTAAMVDWGFRQLNLHRVSLSALANNRRAIRLYASLGFRQEGRLRHEQFRDGRYVDVVLMSILEKEWRSRRRPRKKAPRR